MDEGQLARVLSVTSSHWRLIETGWIPCPVGSAHVLATEMKWNFQALADVLVGLAHADVRKKSSRHVDIAAVQDRFEDLISHNDSLHFFWQWCRAGLANSNIVEGTDDDDSDIRSSPGFSEVLSSLLDYLSNPSSSVARREDTVNSDYDTTLYFQDIISQLQTTFLQMESKLRYAVPVMDSPHGINSLLHQLHKKRIKGCEAYISYIPSAKDIVDSKLDFGFLWNRPNAGKKKPVITLFVNGEGGLDAAELRRHELEINDALRDMRPEGRKSSRSEDRKFLEVLPGARTGQIIAYNMSTRQARIIESEELRCREDVLLNNYWIFNLEKYGLQGFVDNFEKANSNSLNAPKTFEVALTSENTLSLRKEFSEWISRDR